MTFVSEIEPGDIIEVKNAKHHVVGVVESVDYGTASLILSYKNDGDMSDLLKVYRGDIIENTSIIKKAETRNPHSPSVQTWATADVPYGAGFTLSEIKKRKITYPDSEYVNVGDWDGDMSDIPYPANEAEIPGFDPVNNPSHYTEGRNIEPIEAIEDWELGFNLGNAVKYIARAGRKDSLLVDLKKAQFYLNREIENLEND